MENELMQRLGSALQTARIQKGIPLDEASELLNIKPSNIQRIEQGKFSFAAKLLVRYCHTLKIKLQIGNEII
jgi:cytoskeletal protein RodZ